MRIAVIFTLAVSLLLTGCSGNSLQEQELQQAVGFVKKLIDRTEKDQLAANSLASTFEMGGNVIHYVTASMAEDAKFRCFVYVGPAQPWCVVIKPGDSAGDFIIEGYGTDTAKPLMVEKAVAHAPKRD